MCSITHFNVDPRTFLAIENHFSLIDTLEKASGLNVNHQKSKIIGINTDREEVKLIANNFNCRHGQWPNIYLNLPLLVLDSYHSLRRLKEEFSLGVIDTLLSGGRFTLLQATLTNLPTYYVSIFIQKTYCISIFKIQWSWSVMKNSTESFFGRGALPHFVNWEKVTRSICNGGLGLQS